MHLGKLTHSPHPLPCLFPSLRFKSHNFIPHCPEQPAHLSTDAAPALAPSSFCCFHPSAGESRLLEAWCLQLSVNRPLFIGASSEAGNHYRKPQEDKMQRTNDHGCPAPTETPTTHLVFREQGRRRGRKTVRARGWERLLEGCIFWQQQGSCTVRSQQHGCPKKAWTILTVNIPTQMGKSFLWVPHLDGELQASNNF